MTASLVDQAIHFLVERGWPMLPSRGPQKKPCVGWKGFQKSLPTVGQLRGWERQFRPERWGLVTGELAGIVVVDFDGDAGRTLAETWGITSHVQTGSGGFHLYVQHPGWRVPTLNAKTSKEIWPWRGLDIRGDGGFAVLLGQNDRGPYVQLRELDPEPFDSLPKELRTFLRNHGATDETSKRCSTPRSAFTGACVDSERLIRKALEIAHRRGRNNAGFWLACQLRDNGFSIGKAEAAMRDYRSRVPSTNAKGKREQYTEQEMMASLRSAFSITARAPWEKRKPNPHDSTAVPMAPPEKQDASRDAALANCEATHRDSADDPQSIGIYVGYTGIPQVGYTGSPLSRQNYGRVPREVYSDPRLEARDVRIYCVLAAACWQGSVATVGKRLIAKEASCAECKVAASLTRLEAAGHIQRVPGKKGRRAVYVLMSPVFGQKQRAGVEEVVIGPNGPRLGSVRKEQSRASTLTSFPKRPNHQQKSS